MPTYAQEYLATSTILSISHTYTHTLFKSHAYLCATQSISADTSAHTKEEYVRKEKKREREGDARVREI